MSAYKIPSAPRTQQAQENRENYLKNPRNKGGFRLCEGNDGEKYIAQINRNKIDHVYEVVPASGFSITLEGKLYNLKYIDSEKERGLINLFTEMLISKEPPKEDGGKKAIKPQKKKTAAKGGFGDLLGEKDDTPDKKPVKNEPGDLLEPKKGIFGEDDVVLQDDE